ncbi:hypothetical protein [Methylomonas sp. 11b]|uniref:hypothetical protein n=1 Tax=Methylomonas sp. 11b TaxID=1168169 RepID=UPI00047EB5B9|nr:hypothetical protein [Methylomonas sp. 11b]
MAINFIRIAVVYAIIGIGIGIYMAASHSFLQRDTHAHANLLGWVSLALSGLIYQVFPALGNHVLAKAHFWLHNLGLPVTIVGIALLYDGNPAVGEPLAGIGSSVVALGFLALLFNVFRTPLSDQV